MKRPSNYFAAIRLQEQKRWFCDRMNKEISNGIDSFSYRAVPAQFQPNKFFPTDTGASLSGFLELYGASGDKPLDVSFRELVPWVYGGSRGSHYLHSYPAKLLPQIAHFFLANEVLCPRDGVVLDPFSGSGTVALEAVLSGRDAYYCDVNPFARLLTKSKTTAISPCEVDVAMKKVLDAYLECSAQLSPDVVNLSYWYNECTSSHLSKLKQAISSVPREDLRALLCVCFSSVARKLSRANPRFSVPVRLKVNGEPVDVIASAQEVWSCFEKSVEKAKRQISGLTEIKLLGKAQLVSENVLDLGKDWPSTRKKFGEVDMVITSPPYAGAQKYVRATSLSLGWLDQVKSTELKTIENQTLGREHLPKSETLKLMPTSIKEADKIIREISEGNQTRAAIASVFLREMKKAADNTMKALREGGYAVVIMADNTICGRHFPTTSFIEKLFEDAGGVKILELRDKIVSRGLQTKRASTSSSISHETITVFKKV